MTNIQAIALGFIEGLTEFLPISSTGHLTLASHFLNIVQNEQFIVFEIAIQLGAILAVVFFYWRKFFNTELLAKLFIAFIPTAIVGVTIYKHIKTLLASEFIVACSLILGGIVLIIVEKYLVNKKFFDIGFPNSDKVPPTSVSYRGAFLLGVAQSVAMIPGVSRSGATIVAGLLMNIERKVLVEFTFLLAVPTMSAATLYTIYKNLNVLSVENFNHIFLGFAASFVVALLVIKFLINYIKKYDFIPFGWYRIFLGAFILLVLFSS
jgi:undecaprenyl-diphosphatase